MSERFCLNADRVWASMPQILDDTDFLGVFSGVV